VCNLEQELCASLHTLQNVVKKGASVMHPNTGCGQAHSKCTLVVDLFSPVHQLPFAGFEGTLCSKQQLFFYPLVFHPPLILLIIVWPRPYISALFFVCHRVHSDSFNLIY